jgi:hypothetical protein
MLCLLYRHVLRSCAGLLSTWCFAVTDYAFLWNAVLLLGIGLEVCFKTLLETLLNKEDGSSS